jgi:hypothetical protein
LKHFNSSWFSFSRRPFRLHLDFRDVMVLKDETLCFRIKEKLGKEMKSIHKSASLGTEQSSRLVPRTEQLLPTHQHWWIII